MPEPGFLKTASQAEQYGDPATPLQLFADPHGRRFPYHTPAACFRSAQALGDHLDGGNYAELIKVAAASYGIDAEVETVLRAPDRIIKYAYSNVAADGTLQQCLPLRNSAEVQAASQWLTDYRYDLQLADRQKIASVILDAAQEYKTAIDDASRHELLKQAGRGECTTTALKQALLARAVLLGAVAEAGPLRKMAHATTERYGRETRQKLAVLLDQLDREFGLVKHYTEGLRPPEESLFEFTISTLKRAEATEVPLQTGTVFSKTALSRIDRHALQSWLGDDFADSVWTLSNPTEVDHIKLAGVVQEFEPAQARRFEQCAAACGITPLA